MAGCGHDAWVRAATYVCSDTRAGKAYGLGDYETWMLEAALSRPAAHALPGMPTSWLLSQRA